MQCNWQLKTKVFSGRAHVTDLKFCFRLLRTLGHDQLLKCLGFILYPPHFYLTFPSESSRGRKQTIHHQFYQRKLSNLNCLNSGYATQDQIRNYDPRYYAISLEFKTFDENALLLMVVNHENQQNMLIQLQEGMVKFIIDYGDNVKLEFSTKNTYNSGQWVKIEAGRAYRKGVETGVLRVTHSGVREDLMDTLPSLKVIN